MNIGIIGVGSYVPTNIVTNQDLEKRIDTTDEWIFNKVGVKERRIADANQATSDLAVVAANNAIIDAGLTVNDIDLIILATSSPDMIQPPTASIVQGKLGAKNAAAFDVGAVCAGFAFALNVGYSMKLANNYKHVLVIGAEVYSKILDWNDRTTCVFFGDGAGAIILGDVPKGYGILSTFLMTEGQDYNVIRFQAGGTLHPTNLKTIENNMHRFEMDGKKVWNFAIRVFPEAIKKVLTKAQLEVKNIDFIISHQANINIIKKSIMELELTMENTHTTIEKYANTSGASIPLTIDDAVKYNKFKDGHLIAIVGFGGGLSYGSTLFRWYDYKNKICTFR